jgi:hypothetical protein
LKKGETWYLRRCGRTKRKFKWFTQSALHQFFVPQKVKRLGEGQAVNNLVFAVVQVLLSYYKILWEAEME